MTPAERMQAARRAAQSRREQVAELRPLVSVARDAADRWHAAKKKPGVMREQAQQMDRLRWIPGFFPTPAPVVARMLEECGAMHGYRVLEPSAGRGDLADAARAAGARVTCYELVPALAAILREKGHEVTEADFLTVTPTGDFDFVLMNPPFERHADKAHTLHAFEFLAPGGILVALVGAHTGAGLREWADLAEDLPPGSFKNSDRPTGVNITLLVKVRE